MFSIASSWVRLESSGDHDLAISLCIFVEDQQDWVVAVDRFVIGTVHGFI